jgi:hypothetical protein
MSFDHNTGRLFLAMCDDYSEERKLIEINPASGFVYDCGTLYDNAWLVGLYTKPLEVVSHTPAGNAANVELNTLITVTFDKNITENDLSRIIINPTVSGVLTSVSGNVLSIAHDDFKEGTQYTVTIPAGAIDDYWETISWKFTTKKGESVPLYSENNVKIYPNPSNGKINVVVSENATLKITDVLGREIDSYTLNAHSVLNLTLSSGLYFIQVKSDSKTSTHKVVVR